jgi:hypothetical protein
MVKEVKMTSSFCYNDQDFREVMENVAKGKPASERWTWSADEDFRKIS